MLQHVWERARKCTALNDLVIACDDERVWAAAQQFHAKTIMTSKEHPSGTDRIAEVMETMEGDIVVNIQGDEPLMDPSVIDVLVRALIEDKACAVATVIKAIENTNELKNPNVVKVVVDGERNALYFSRSLIPFNRDKDKEIVYYKHLGIYAYRKDFLTAFRNLPKSNLEKSECLEQLRALEFGYKIKTVLTDKETIGIDTPEDLNQVVKLLS